MVERYNTSGHDQAESCDNGIDRAAFGELGDRCDYVSEPWLTHAGIYDEDGAVAVSDERSATAHEACETGVYHLAGGCVVTDADLEADAARFEVGELVSGGSYRNRYSYITMKSQLRACQLRDSGPRNAHDPGSIVNGQA